MKSNLLFFAVLLSFCTGCGYTYSPFLQLPQAPMPGGTSQVGVSSSVLGTTDGAFSPGTELLARYAFSDHVTLELKGWSRFSTFGYNVWDGVSANGLVELTDSSDQWRFALTERIMLFRNGNGVGAAGLALGGAVWLPEYLGTRPYVGIGGFSGAERRSGGFGQSEWAAGMVYNIGFGFPLVGAFDVNLELAGVTMYRSNGSNIARAMPMAALTYNF